MIRLVGAELNRLLSRRVAIILALGVIAGVGLFQLGVAKAVSPPSAESVAEARQAYEDGLKQWQQDHERLEKECLDQGSSEAECAIPAPTEADYGLVPTPFAQIAAAGVTFAAVLTMLAAYLIGASYIGAEYSSGALGNWLTFVPRRGQVFASKATGLAVGAAALATVTGALMIGLAAIVTSVIGQPVAGVGPLAEMAARTIPLTMVAALLGFCVAMLTGYTVAALGALLGYGIVIVGLNILSFVVPALSLLKPWQVETNISAFLMHDAQYYVVERVVTEDGVAVQQVARTLTFEASSGYLAVLLVALLAVSFLVFRRRDVT